MENTTEKHLPLSPFTMETALQKVQMTEDTWNSQVAKRVCLACIGRKNLIINSKKSVGF